MSNFLSPPLILAWARRGGSKVLPPNSRSVVPTHLPALPRPAPPHTCGRGRRKEPASTWGGGGDEGKQVGAWESQTSRQPRSRSGGSGAAAESPASREPPTPPLGEEGAETPLGAEEEEEAGRLRGGRQTLPTRLGARSGRGSRRPARRARRAPGAGGSAPRLTPVPPPGKVTAPGTLEPADGPTAIASRAGSRACPGRPLPAPQALRTHW